MPELINVNLRISSMYRFSHACMASMLVAVRPTTAPVPVIWQYLSMNRKSASSTRTRLFLGTLRIGCPFWLRSVSYAIVDT